MWNISVGAARAADLNYRSVESTFHQSLYCRTIDNIDRHLTTSSPKFLTLLIRFVLIEKKSRDGIQQCDKKKSYGVLREGSRKQLTRPRHL